MKPNNLKLKTNTIYISGGEYYTIDNHGFLMVWIDGRWRGSRMSYNFAIVAEFEELKPSSGQRDCRVIYGKN